ncbi:transglycosylase family protein [Streptomyces sp. NPDC014685]|uniref:transglycosylase family protein n=1 Tax=Streptomyces sp. NPDC014685 TaxID=3364881 RepID=UPI0036F4EFD9
MGSANGKHRRPRQAPAIVVAAGVTGSAIAIPLLGASGAHAADATTWDRVAECESGGTWSADFGNGSYGGLQLSPETWKAYGGESYAERADLASRAQQIAVAQKVLEDQGPQAWPSCAVISGLATDGALPGVDPGTAPGTDPGTVASADPERSGKPAGETSKPPAGEADPSEGATDGAGAVDGEDGSSAPGGADEPSGAVTPSPDPSSGTPTAPSSEGSTEASTETPSDTPEKSVPSGSPESSSGQGGKHRGAPAVEDGREVGVDEGRESGRHASRGGDGARDTDVPAAGDPYTVRPGDNLWVIADEQKVPGGWVALYEANRAEVGSDPDLILPGQRLDLEVSAE